jgi:hypothetical protein
MRIGVMMMFIKKYTVFGSFLLFWLWDLGYYSTTGSATPEW